MSDTNQYRHRCTDKACPFLGQATSKSCLCHVDEKTMMLARITQLKTERAEMLELIAQADPWVFTRRSRHSRKAQSDKEPYYQARHAREVVICDDWMMSAAQFLPCDEE